MLLSIFYILVLYIFYVSLYPVHYVSAIVVFCQFLEHSKLLPTTGALHIPFPLLGILLFKKAFTVVTTQSLSVSAYIYSYLGKFMSNKRPTDVGGYGGKLRIIMCVIFCLSF
jgi:hypothetical protein